MSTIENAITDIARSAVDDVRLDLEAKIKAVADMPVPLATEDADMIRSLIAKVDALDGRLDRFEASMAEAIAKLRG